MTSSLPLHGNYHGYYLKRPYHSDSRLALLSAGTFRNKVVLDVGCNEGRVTCEIAQSLEPTHVIGVDLDESLIRAAWRHRRTVWSLQQPQSATKKRKREAPIQMQANFFPASFEHTLGSLPIPIATPQTSNNFPHNITFRTANWVHDTIPEDQEGYDVILALSISKWIHLHDGDKGLRHFFQRVHSSLKPDGTFVLEPQEWESYSRVKRIDKTLKDKMQDLELRPSDFHQILEQIGFVHVEHFRDVGEGGFRRPIDLYRKNKYDGRI